jgi:hypothetical protein
MTPFSLGPSLSLLDSRYILATSRPFMICLPMGDLILLVEAGDLGIFNGSGGQNDHG